MTSHSWYGASWRGAVLLVLIALTLFPIWLMVVTSVKTNNQFYDNFLALMLPLHWSNFSLAWQEISPYVLNSVVVTATTLVGVVTCSTLAAYAFARLRFVGKEVLYYMIIALLMIPSILTLVPQFVLVNNFGLLDTRWALILPYISAGIAFAVFVLRSFFAGPTTFTGGVYVG